MPVFLLPSGSSVFPHPSLSEDSGLLAVGGDLSTESLFNAYSHGIFPWYNEGEPVMWFCPLPRFVLFPEEFTYPKSLRPYLNQNTFEVTFNRDFASVIDQCQKTPRPGQQGTWITREMKEAFIQFHREGYAMSVEVWEGDLLVGGIYGVYMGKIFSGESMFAHTSNASKVGFVKLVEHLKGLGCRLIDCQQETEHLMRFGARSIPGPDFLTFLRNNRRTML